MNSKKNKTIVIGVSAGGMEALSIILPNFPKDFSCPIIIVQHINADSDSYLVHYLNEKSLLSINEAQDKQKIEKAKAYIAPPGYHLLIEEDLTFTLSVDPKVNYARPSIDVLFESAAEVFEDKLIGVILTGASSDGALGLKKIKDCGGLAIAQNPDKAVAKVMPWAAIQQTNVDHILELEKIGPFLLKFHQKESDNEKNVNMETL